MKYEKPNLVRLSDAQKMLGVSMTTIYRWANAGTICHASIGRRAFITLASIRALGQTA